MPATSRTVTTVRWILRIVLAVQALGLGAQYLWSDFEGESDIYGLLFFDLGLPEARALAVEDLGTWLYVIVGLALLVLPLVDRVSRPGARGTDARGTDAAGPGASESASGARRWLRRGALSLEVAGLLWLVVWHLAISSLQAYRGGSFMAEWTVAAHAVRIFAPLALLVLLGSAEASLGATRLRTAGWILALASAATFATHGVEAIRQNPQFVDLLIGSAEHLLGLRITQEATTVVLWVIGIIDLVLAVVVPLTLLRVLTVYMSVWGFVTAASRITAAGTAGLAWAYPDTLVRAANGGVPLALCVLTSALAAEGGLFRKTQSQTSQSSTSQLPTSEPKVEKQDEKVALPVDSK